MDKAVKDAMDLKASERGQNFYKSMDVCNIIKAVEIDNIKAFIEEALRQMINKNCSRTKFSERFKSIIDRYNAGGSENEDYYEQLLQLIKDMQKENERPNDMGLTEEELEIFDLLTKGKKLTPEKKTAASKSKKGKRNTYT